MTTFLDASRLVVSRSWYSYLYGIPGVVPPEPSPGRPIPGSTADVSANNPCRPCGEPTAIASGAVSGNPNESPLVNPLGQRFDAVAPAFAMASITGDIGGTVTTDSDCGCDKPFNLEKDWWKVLAGAVVAWVVFR